MSIIQGTAKPTSGDTGFYDFPIGQSLRFDGSSSYLSKNFSSNGNRQTWSFSAWLKLSNLDNSPVFFSQKGGTGNSQRCAFYFSTSGQIIVSQYTGSADTFYHKSNALFRDLSAWYHVVVVADTTNSTSGNRINIYVNSTKVTDFATNTVISQHTNTYVNAGSGTSYPMYIGRDEFYTSRDLGGYMAEINFIDDQALNPYYFGAFKNGSVWIPKQFDGTASDTTYNVSGASNAYGTNGFHLDFADSSNIGNDVSGNNNDWTVN